MARRNNSEIMENRADKTCHGRWMSEDYEPGLVSVITPTYNRARLLIETMDSVLNQAYRPIELIVVDDGSADNTKEAVERWAEKRCGDNKFVLRYFQQEHLRGQVARNRGLIESHGQYIKFLDSDDVLKFSAIEHQVGLISSCENEVAVFSNWYKFKERRNRIDLFRARNPDVHMDVLENWVSGWHVPLHSILWKREDVLSQGPWDESLTAHQDGEYMFRFLVCGGRLKLCPDAWVYYRIHDHTISRTKNHESMVSRMKVAERIERLLAQKNLLKKYRLAVSLRYYCIAGRAAGLCPDVADTCLRKFRALSPNSRTPGTIEHRILVKLIGLTLKQKMVNFLHSRFDISRVRPIATISHIEELYFANFEI